MRRSRNGNASRSLPAPAGAAGGLLVLALLLFLGPACYPRRHTVVRGGAGAKDGARETAQREAGGEREGEAEAPRAAGTGAPAVLRVSRALGDTAPLRPRWALDLGDRQVRRLHLPPAESGVNYLLAETVSNDLIAIDRRSGRTAFWIRLEGEILDRPAFTEFHLYFVVENFLVCLERQSGDVVWRLPIEMPPAFGPTVSEPVRGRPLIYLPALDRRVYALTVESFSWPPPNAAGPLTREDIVIEKQTLRIAWRTPTFGFISGRVVVDEPWIYLGDDRQNLYGISAAQVDSGRLEPDWIFRGRRAMVGSPLVYGPSIYVANRDHHIYCISTRDGAEIWRYQSGFTLDAPPSILLDPHLNRAYVVFKAGEGPLIALDETDGSVRWEREDAEAVLARYDDMDRAPEERAFLVTRDADGSLRGRVLTTGEAEWKMPAGRLGHLLHNTYAPFVFGTIEDGRVLCALQKN